jgi:Amt family ammonium transporter
LPLRTIAGAIAFGFGWLAWLTTDPILQANRSIDLAFGATNVLLGASAATIVALAYGWFTTGKPDPFLAARGAMGGWIALTATALFVPTWAAIAIGAIAGLWLPIGLYCFDRFLHLDDPTGSIATAGLSGLWSIIAAGLLADGTYGAGWNNIGVRDYLGVPGQGVTGLLAGVNLQNDPGQMSAQITGAITIVFLALIVTWLLTRPLRRLNERGLGTENWGSGTGDQVEQPRNQMHNHSNGASEKPSEEVII